MVYESFYPGAKYPLEPEYGDLFTGYRVPAGEIGLATDPRTANIIQEVSTKLNPGGKAIEISTIRPADFDSIPKQQFKEVGKLAKLTGVKISIHGPMVEPSGYTEEGKWSETNRKFAENQILSSVERSHDLDEKGNIPVTFHPSYVLPAEKILIKEEGVEKPKSMIIADTRTGELGQIKETEKYFPEEGGLKKEFDPELELKKRNEEAWIQTLNNLNFYAMRGDEEVRSSLKKFEEEAGKEISEKILKAYAQEGKEKIIEKFPEPTQELATNVFRRLDHGSIFLRDSYNSLRELYNRVYKEATLEDKKKLDEFANSVKSEIEAGIEKNPEKLKRFAEIIEKGVHVMKDLQSPKMFQPLNKFLIDKDAETFSNVAFNSYKKFGDKAPIISIENAPYGSALSSAEELKKLIEETRKKFVEQAKKEGLSESEAKGTAERLIGATWDVGHINMLRRYGYNEADVIKQTEKIAPMVKHVHLSDNFGYEHTELPMGMGNVPIKDIFEKLGKKGEEARKIIEAGNWYQFFKTPPLTQTYEALGSPLFPMKAPYWNQVSGTQGNYFAFPSAYLPEQHFTSIYGGGFSNLPMELGGQMPGKQQRLTGTPME